MQRPPREKLLQRKDIPESLRRVIAATDHPEPIWIGANDAVKLSKEEEQAYRHAHAILCHLAVRAPTAHASGHPGGPLSAFTFAYFLRKRRNPHVDQPLRMSAGHLSLLAYGLDWLFGAEGTDKRLASPQAIIEHFRVPSGLPGHIEAGIGQIPFGTGPLGKGVSNALGAAFGLHYLHQNSTLPSTGLRAGSAQDSKLPLVDCILADGDCQEGQVMEAFRLASRLGLGNLVVHGDFNDVQLSDEPSKTVAPDFAAIAAACGWQVIEVENGNDPGQVHAALDRADACAQKGTPIFVCYYTTMGHGVRLMEEGSNTGKENFHGSPLSKEKSEAAIKELPDFEEAIRAYEPFRAKEKKRFTSKTAVSTDILLPWKLPKGYARAITAEKGAARKDFGATHLKALMAGDPRIIVLHADLAGSGGFDAVSKIFPDRVINVGVAEANMAMMAAGMRQVGLLPVTYTFAAFGTNEARANARLIDINCAHTRCGVVHDCTHSGVSVGEDGETHQEQNYLNLPFRSTQVWCLAESNQAAAAAERAIEIIAEGHESVYVFSPRSGHPQLLRSDGKPFYDASYQFDGHADIVRGFGDTRDGATIITTGICLHAAIAAADAFGQKPETRNQKPTIRVLNVACVRPLDAAAILQAALETAHLIVVEDHNTEGGLATQVADVIADFELPCSLRRLGLTHFFPSGTDKDLLTIAGLDAESVTEAIEDELRSEVKGGEDAFVTVIFTILKNSQQSRFRESVQPFLLRLSSDKTYLDALREAWRKRTPTKLPSNAELRERL